MDGGKIGSRDVNPRKTDNPKTDEGSNHCAYIHRGAFLCILTKEIDKALG